MGEAQKYTLHKEIIKLLKEIAADENFMEYVFEESDGSSKGDGYIGIIKSIKIVGKDKYNKPKAVTLMVKSASTNSTLIPKESITTMFKREVHMYTTVCPTFQALELEQGLLQSSFVAKFYKAQVSNKPEVLIMENLKDAGYKLYERRIPMDDDHVSLVVATYARFHALSFALRDQHPKQFKEIVESMDNHFVAAIIESNFIENFIEKCAKPKEALNSETDQEAIQIYEAFLSSIHSFFEQLLQSVDRYSVVLHGDCWTNNMMFKYEDKEAALKPTQVRFLDFQISRQGSPILDLSYFIYTCSSIHVINNLDHYLDLYYNTLTLYLRKLGSDPENIFPYHILKQHWKKYAKYGFIFAMLVIHIMLTEKEETVNLVEVSTSEKDITNAFDYQIGKFEEYLNRVKPIILHFVDNHLF